MKFMVYIENRMVAEVSGSDFAYEVYARAGEVAEMIGESGHLVEGETGEIIANSDDWDDYDRDYEPDCGDVVDPYV